MIKSCDNKFGINVCGCRSPSNFDPLDTQFVFVLVVSEFFKVLFLLRACSASRWDTCDCTPTLKSVLVIGLFS